MATQQDASELRRALAACRGSFVWVGVFSLFINLLMLVPPLYMLQVYDRVLATRSLDTLLMLTLVVVGLFVAMGGLELVRSRILVRVGNRLDSGLSPRLYRAMFRRGLLSQGRQSAQPLSDLATLRQFLSGNGLFAFFDAPWAPVYLAVLFLFHPWLGGFATLAGLLLLGLTIAGERATRPLLSEASHEQIEAQELANANLRNAEVLHAMGMLPGIMNRWAARHRRYLAGQSRASDRAGLLSNAARTLRQLSQSLILGLGAWLVLRDALSPGMMIAGSILMGRALAPIDQMIGGWKGFVGARQAHARLATLLDAVPEEIRRLSLPTPRGELRVEGVTAAPPGARLATLRGLDFRVAAGEQVGIIGPSAAGKSSLARVLLGLWPTRIGSVRLDGAEIGHYNRDELGPHIGYLPQDIELFDGTIAENIARFDDAGDDAAVVAAARRAGVHEMILALPEGYDTRITSSGGSLSGGQRQRIGLARALYGNPVLVVLDEPNANLDDAGERALGEALARLKEAGTTLFVISHRTRVLSNMDRLLVLREGKLAAFGPREEILAQLAGKPRRRGSQATRARLAAAQGGGASS